MLAQAPTPAPAMAPGSVASLPQASMTNPPKVDPTDPARDPARMASMDKPPEVAAIIDEAPPARDADVGRGEPELSREPSNPLSVLAMTPPAAAPATSGSKPSAAANAGPTRQAADQRAQLANAPRAAKPASTPPRKPAKPSDTDAALLSALMNYGLPPASPPGTRVYKSDGVFMREMPGSPLSERLKECRKLSFIEGEQCRLRVCAGQWGTAIECPTPQANVEP